MKRFNKNGTIKKWKSKLILKKKYFETEMPAHTTFFIKKKIFSKFLYDTKFNISSDFDFLIKLFENFQGKYVNEVFIKMRTGGKSSQLKNFKLKMQEDIKILQKKYKYKFLLVYFLKLILRIKQKVIF